MSAALLKVALLRRPEEASAATISSLSIRVRDVMQSHVAVVRATASLREVARALSLGGFHALPVFAVNDAPSGIVTSSDLVALLLDQIEREAPDCITAAPPREEPGATIVPRLLEVPRAAEVY